MPESVRTKLSELYDSPNYDSSLFKSYLGLVPLTGFFCNGEIGPVGREDDLGEVAGVEQPAIGFRVPWPAGFRLSGRGRLGWPALGQEPAVGGAGFDRRSQLEGRIGMGGADPKAKRGRDGAAAQEFPNMHWLAAFPERAIGPPRVAIAATPPNA